MANHKQTDNTKDKEKNFNVATEKDIKYKNSKSIPKVTAIYTYNKHQNAYKSVHETPAIQS